MKPLVLVVEDISVLAETYAAALRRADWEVEIAPSGAAALHCAERRAAGSGARREPARHERA